MGQFMSVLMFKVRFSFGKWRPRSAVSTGFAKLVAINVNEFCNIITTAGAVQAGMGCGDGHSLEMFGAPMRTIIYGLQ